MCWGLAMGQGKRRIPLKDSLDGKFDASDYIIDANGFVPVPYIITEPAVGGFGGVLAPIFLKKNRPYVDSVNGKRIVTPVAPTITGGAAMYTVNNSWALLGFRSGTLVKSRIKYLVGGGYLNMNLAFYPSFDRLGERKMEFNLKMAPFTLETTKRIGVSYWYAGLKYLFLKTDVKYTGNDTLLADLGKKFETNKLVSEVGGIVEFDSRDNIFTPNRGIRLYFDAIRSDNVFGSDFDFWRFDYTGYGYLAIGKQWIGALRVDGAQVTGDIPFYLKPYIDMRGIPAERYQGNVSVLSEAELRWDFRMRWSIVGFSGVGKAFDEWSDFGSADWVISYGAGFRYLLARKFGLRMGIDLAHGAGSFAYYIVFGSSWLR
jgi:hypothetical protein